MNRQVVGQAARLPLGRLALEAIAGETPAQTAGTAAPLQPGRGSESQCIRKTKGGFPGISRGVLAESPATDKTG